MSYTSTGAFYNQLFQTVSYDKIFCNCLGSEHLHFLNAYKMYVNEEDVPLIAKNEVIAKKSNHIWKFLLASVALGALGLAVVSVNYGFHSNSTTDIILSEAKMRMSEVGTLKYAGLSAGEKSSLFSSFKSNFARKVLLNSGPLHLYLHIP